MNHYPESVRRLIRCLARLPGIGEKTAERLAVHMLKAPRAEIDELARSLLEVREKVRICSGCFALSDEPYCRICKDPTRDGAVICVVEQPGDMAAIERSGAFRGKYHILQGALSPINGIGPDNLRIKELLQRVSGGDVKEVVIATGTNVEGESTAAYLADLLKDCSVCVTRIASGVPMGGDLKYVDQVTLKRAMDTRHGF